MGKLFEVSTAFPVDCARMLPPQHTICISRVLEFGCVPTDLKVDPEVALMFVVLSVRIDRLPMPTESAVDGVAVDFAAGRMLAAGQSFVLEVKNISDSPAHFYSEVWGYRTVGYLPR